MNSAPVVTSSDLVPGSIMTYTFNSSAISAHNDVPWRFPAGISTARRRSCDPDHMVVSGWLCFVGFGALRTKTPKSSDTGQQWWWCRADSQDP
jgi:hypothetical protein